MMVPILLVFIFRCITPFLQRWKHDLWGSFIAVLMAITVFSISLFEIPFFPFWTGLEHPSLLLILWVLYGQLCANMGALGGLSPRFETVAYGALCGLWASVQQYKDKPHKLALAICGAFGGRIGVPVLLFASDLFTLVPFSIFSIGIIHFFSRVEESNERSPNKELWIMSGVTWLLSWYNPLFALFIGVGFGLFYTRSIQGWRHVLSFCLFGICVSSLLSGIGLFELCTRYMEGGVMGEQAGLSYDILVFGFVYSLFIDPMVSALSVQSIWDRALDVQHLSSVQGLYIITALGQIFFAFSAAGCLRKGKWLCLLLLVLGISYMIIWEALL